MASEQDVVERLNAALIGRYHIESEFRSGGMATVYLAQDLKHDRKVALKVLKPELAAVVGTERFRAEIRTTANLSHPHILPLHDSGEADGFLFYVMLYVEGESLRDRLDWEGQLSVEEAVKIAGHMADALNATHEDGVIHRDLKPGNILFKRGEPVVTDFGIALAVSAAGEGRLTETGLSLGTPYYVSPEQAAGDQTPTAASDVYSLGCVLYEMLTGEPPPTGSSAQAIVGKILLADVTRPTKLRRTIPANVEGAVLRALERLPADRFESMAELAAALTNKAFRHGVGVGVAGGPGKGLVIALATTTALARVTLVAVIRWPEPPLPVMQAEIQRLGYLGRYRYTALAPDGSSMVYADTAGLESGTQLWVKERASARGAPLPGTDGARDVVFAPDGEWIAYSVGTDIITRPLRGGGAVTQLEDVRGNVIAMSWMDDGTILCDVASGQCRLVRLSAAGKAPPDTLELNTPTGMVWVHGLPGSEGALIVTCPGGLCSETAALGVVDLRDGSTRTLLEGVSAGWYTPTGHLVCLLWNQEPRPERPVKSVSATGPIRILLRGGGLSSS